MKKHNDGGSAFPGGSMTELENRGSAWGMSLRDYFAAAALQAITDVPSVGPGKWHQWAGEWAAWSYSVADAMLVERAKERKQP